MQRNITRSSYTDFSVVDIGHKVIDARLTNWARWCRPAGSSFIQPMFRGYRADESFDDVNAQQKPLPIDVRDAVKVEKGVSGLPDNHRYATIWAYRVRTQPVKLCKELGVSREGLGILIRDSRQLLLNRNV